MSILRQIREGLRALFHGREADAEVTRELRHYLDEATQEYERSGLPHAEAVRAATIDMGNVTTARETVRSAGWEHRVETLAADVHYALRRSRRFPGFSTTVVVTLALGIGASTTVFSVIRPILVEPLPFPRANELVTIDDRNDEGVPMPLTFGTYLEVVARARSLSATALADGWKPSLVGTAEPEQLRGQRVTPSYFDVYRIAPAVGRGLSPADGEPGAPNVAVISDAMLERRFAGDRSVVGRTIDLDGQPFLIVGVMPPSFDNVIATGTDIWSPLHDHLRGGFDGREWGHHYKMIARLAAGASIAGADRELAGIARNPIAAFARPPWASLGRGLVVRSLQDDVTGTVRPSLLAILGAVALLLVIAVVNVTNLLLARGSQRRAEMAMRIALGASRARIIRQLLTESVVLALAGGVLGLVIAQVGIGALIAASPPGLPRVEDIHLSAPVFAFTFALTAFVGIVAGLAPAVGSARAEANEGLHQTARPRVTGSSGLRNALVIAEVALALVLLVGAGLMYRSVVRLTQVAPGINPDHVVTMQVVVPGATGTNDSTRGQFFAAAADAVRHLPGVVSAGFASQLPFSGDVDGYGIEAQSLPSSSNGAAGNALRYSVTSGYLAAMGIPLRQGRPIGDDDRAGTPEAVLINESLARRLFGDRNPLGERMHFGPEMGDSNSWATVVGVVGDVKHYGLAADAPDAFYVMNGQWRWTDNAQTLVVRAAGDPSALVPSIRRAIWSVNPDRPIQRIRTMESLVAASAGRRRFVLAVIETFALAALTLATVGLYGVIAGSVVERIREIGIRAAMGATPSDIVREVVKRSLTLAGIGAMIGVPLALGATRLLQTMLFGVSRLDPPTYASVVGVVIGIAMFAAWAPARRAAGIDPTIALRAD